MGEYKDFSSQRTANLGEQTDERPRFENDDVGIHIRG